MLTAGSRAWLALAHVTHLVFQKYIQLVLLALNQPTADSPGLVAVRYCTAKRATHASCRFRSLPANSLLNGIHGTGKGLGKARLFV